MIIGNKEDNFKKLLLFSSLDYERYRPDYVARELGYESITGITHENINTQQKTGRIVGECSLILASRFLEKFVKVIISNELKDTMQRKNVVVAYSIGDRVFLLLPGMEFIKIYAGVLREFHINHNLCNLCVE